MLPVCGLLPGASLCVDALDPAQIGRALLQSVFVGGMHNFSCRLQGAGGPVLISLLGSVAALLGVSVAILLLDGAPPHALAPAVALISAGVARISPRSMGKARS